MSYDFDHVLRSKVVKGIHFLYREINIHLLAIHPKIRSTCVVPVGRPRPIELGLPLPWPDGTTPPQGAPACSLNTHLAPTTHTETRMTFANCWPSPSPA